MQHLYNNWSCKIFEGFYESHLYNSDTLYYIEQTDRDEGYLKTNEYYDFDDWQEFKNEVAELAVNELLNILPDNEIIQDMKLKEVYSPKYYNYETDSLIINTKLNLRKLKIYCFKTKNQAFKKYLKDNFTSYDGFISFIANNLTDFLNDFNQPHNERELNVMIEFYLLTQIYENDFDFNGFDTSYHLRIYDRLTEIIYSHLKVCTEEQSTELENQLAF